MWGKPGRLSKSLLYLCNRNLQADLGILPRVCRSSFSLCSKLNKVCASKAAPDALLAPAVRQFPLAAGGGRYKGALLLKRERERRWRIGLGVVQ